jgi:hypothetical protein
MLNAPLRLGRLLCLTKPLVSGQVSGWLTATSPSSSGSTGLAPLLILSLLAHRDPFDGCDSVLFRLKSVGSSAVGGELNPWACGWVGAVDEVEDVVEDDDGYDEMGGGCGWRIGTDMSCV